MLNDPIKIGKLVIKNRMVMPPMNTNFSNENGSITPQMTEYYVRRARGGAGLIIVEAASVVPDIINHGVQPLLHDEKYIPAWANMVEKIKRYGAKVSVEIAHYGSEGSIGPKVSASDVSSSGKPVRPLTVEEIQVIIGQFAKTVHNAKLAGFDAVTLHAAHGYGLSQFLSPLYNKRTDMYGGSVENRTRILVEIIEKCKEAVGRDYPIMVRFSGDEYVEGGRDIKDSVAIAKILEKAGVAALDVSSGTPASYIFSLMPYSLPGLHGFLIPLAREIKKAVSIPVIGVGGIRDAEFAESILQNGDADMVALGRTLIADPDFCRKAASGESGKVRKCLSCQHCLETLDSGRSLRCAVNAEAGREYEFDTPDKAETVKKVLVAGAGPAGLEAARIAALRGHKVTLVEKSDAIGGTLKAAMQPPHKEKLKELVEWYKKRLAELKVDILLNTELCEAVVSKMKPDALIISCGAAFARRIPGSENSGIITAVDALQHPEKVGKKIAIIGGGVTGCETAEFFMGETADITFKQMKDLRSGEVIYTKQTKDAPSDREITVIEMLDAVCSDMDKYNKPLMLIRLKENGVRILTSCMVEVIDGSGVHVKNLKDGSKDLIQADTVILAGGAMPVAVGDYGTVQEVYKIGDCNKVGKIADAVYEGYYTARML